MVIGFYGLWIANLARFVVLAIYHANDRRDLVHSILVPRLVATLGSIARLAARF